MNKLSGQRSELGDVLLPWAKVSKWWIVRVGSGGVAPSSSEGTVTGAYSQLPSQAVVVDVFANVLTASTGATKTFSFGLLSTSSGGSRTGFMSSVSAATTGIVRPTATAATSGPGTGGMIYATNTYGSFLSQFTSGSTAAGDPGLFIKKNFASDSVTAKTFSFTPDSTDWIAFSADVYVKVVDLTV